MMKSAPAPSSPPLPPPKSPPPLESLSPLPPPKSPPPLTQTPVIQGTVKRKLDFETLSPLPPPKSPPPQPQFLPLPPPKKKYPVKKKAPVHFLSLRHKICTVIDGGEEARRYVSSKEYQLDAKPSGLLKVEPCSKLKLMSRYGMPPHPEDLIKDKGMFTSLQKNWMTKNVFPIRNTLLRKIRNNCLLLHNQEFKLVSISYDQSANVQHVSTYAHFRAHAHASDIMRGFRIKTTRTIFHVALRGGGHLFLVPFFHTRVLYLKKSGKIHYTTSSPPDEIKKLFEYKPTEDEMFNISLIYYEKYGDAAFVEMSKVLVIPDSYDLFMIRQEISGYLDMYMITEMTEEEKTETLTKMIERSKRRCNVGEICSPPCVVMIFIAGRGMRVIWEQPDYGMVITIGSGTKNEVVYQIMPIQRSISDLRKKVQSILKS